MPTKVEQHEPCHPQGSLTTRSDDASNHTSPAVARSSQMNSTSASASLTSNSASSRRQAESPTRFSDWRACPETPSPAPRGQPQKNGLYPPSLLLPSKLQHTPATHPP